MELWIRIKDYPNYEVSSNGRVRNINTGHILRPGVKQNGYEIVVLRNSNKNHTELVHRLVADNFYDGCHDGLVVDHIDTNKRNNFVGNLEWCTSSENNKRAYKTGVKTPVKPINQPSCKRVRVLETGKTYRSINDCADSIGANHRRISDCLNGRLKSHHGYHFEEID